MLGGFVVFSTRIVHNSFAIEKPANRVLLHNFGNRSAIFIVDPMVFHCLGRNFFFHSYISPEVELLGYEGIHKM